MFNAAQSAREEFAALRDWKHQKRHLPEYESDAPTPIRPPLPKPAHGGACNSCGACCMTIVCPVGVAILGDIPGPCPALEPQADGRQLCGVYAHPARHLPVRAAIVGEGVLRVALGIVMGQGADATGCDAHRIGEPYNRPYAEAVDNRLSDPVGRLRIRAAFAAIGREVMGAAAIAARKKSRTGEWLPDEISLGPDRVVMDGPGETDPETGTRQRPL